MPKILANVAGITFPNDDGSSRQEIVSRMNKGRKIRLRDAATDEYPESIAVFNCQNEQLGHLPKEVAEYVRQKVSDLSEIQASVCESGVGRSGNHYCTLRLEHHSFSEYVVGKRPYQRKNDHIDWEDLRRRLAIPDDQQITGKDVDLYLKIRESTSSAPNNTPPLRSSYHYDERRKVDPMVILLIVAVVLCAIFFALSWR